MDNLKLRSPSPFLGGETLSTWKGKLDCVLRNPSVQQAQPLAPGGPEPSSPPFDGDHVVSS
jgi:hypothetical protein